MSLFCNQKFTPLQRRSVRLMGCALILTLLTNLSTPNLPNPLLDVFPGVAHLLLPPGQQPSLPRAVVLALLAMLPILLAVWVAARYLRQEPDEFIRALVTNALLWGFAVALAGSAFAGVFVNVYARPFPVSILAADLFFASAGIAFRVLQRSYR